MATMTRATTANTKCSIMCHKSWASSMQQSRRHSYANTQCDGVHRSASLRNAHAHTYIHTLHVSTCVLLKRHVDSMNGNQLRPPPYGFRRWSWRSVSAHTLASLHTLPSDFALCCMHFICNMFSPFHNALVLLGRRWRVAEERRTLSYSKPLNINRLRCAIAAAAISVVSVSFQVFVFIFIIIIFI